MTPAKTEEVRELKKWNWGALFLAPLWAMANNLSFTWMLLSFVPGVGFYLAYGGNRLAFKKRKIEALEDYVAYQDNWSKWGLRFFWGSLTVGILTLPLW